MRLDYPHGGQCWLVTGYDDVRTVYSSKNFGRSADAPRITACPLFAGGLATMDDSVHLKLRRTVTAELNKRMGSIRSSAESIMADRMSALRDGGTIDYVAEVAKPYSIRVLGELLNISADDDEKLIEWVCALLADDSIPDAAARAESAGKRLGRRVMELVTTRSENLGDDVVSDFIRHDALSYIDVVMIVFGLIIAGFESTAHMLSKMVFQLLLRPDLWAALQEDPSRIPGAVEELLRTTSLGGGEAIPWLTAARVSDTPGVHAAEAAALGMALLFAGHETTVNAISNGMLTLLDTPDRWRRLVTEPALVPSAIEELLRVPCQSSPELPRYARTDMEVDGATVCQGDLVLMDVSAANLDPEAFPEPERFDLARRSSAHLTFGHGLRYCIGAPLARIELQEVFSQLISRFPDMRLAVPAAELRRQENMLAAELVELPVTW
ncbi:cytochrome P450 [Nocardia sp. NPDC101769]|uniref:cytochrome P450 n=1 Tax=Nocardia sp. NPDC101769 TaxID=3364333 RepID=UPI0037F50606